MTVNALLIIAVSLSIAGLAYVLDAGIAGAPGLDSVFQWMSNGWFAAAYFCICILFLVFFLIPWIQQGESAEQKIEYLTAFCLGLFFVGGIAYALLNSAHLAALQCDPKILCSDKWYLAYAAAPIAAIVALVVLGIAAVIGLGRPAAKPFLYFAAFLAAVFLVSAVLAVANTPLVIKRPVISLIISAALFGWLSNLDINRASLSSYYRKGLMHTYLQTEPAVPADQALSVQHPSVPYHLIGASINLPTSTTHRLNERNADLFLFSPKFCGSRTIDYHATDKPPFNKLKKSTAMVISGAAVSPLAGRNTAYGLTPWLALFSARLGYWLGNPLSPKGHDKPTPLLLWRELIGAANEKSSHINVSDGGHIENLGVYELLKRRCQTIICIDGEADPSMEFDGLLRLIQLAKVDMDIDIEMELDDFAPSESGYSYSHFALAKITYPLVSRNNAEPANNIGYMLYIKSSLTGNEPPYILDYKRKNPDFPHQPTADQFFSEAQFEAYRALGYHVAEDLFRDLDFDNSMSENTEPNSSHVEAMMQKYGGMQRFFTHIRSKLSTD